MNTITLALADDEVLFLNGLKAIFEQHPHFSVAITANDGGELLAKLEGQSRDIPDIVLLDLRMKGMDGVETAQQLRQIYPELKVIILSSHYRESFIGYMLKLKVNAFLPKNIDPGTLMEVLEKVHTMGLYFTPQQMQSLQEELSLGKKPMPPQLNPDDALTPRELEVLKLICDQHTNAEIAEKLFISVRTVEGHRNKLLLKAGVKNTVGLVLFALFHNFIDPEKKLLEFQLSH